MPLISPPGAAMLHTTVAFTMAKGADGLNVLPQEAYVTANLRFIPHQPTDEDVYKRQEILEQMQTDMLERARAHRDAHTHVATNMAELEDILNNEPGFVKAMWCGDQACEDAIKEATAATSRVMPFDQTPVGDTCVCCGKKADKVMIFAKAY